VGQFGSLRAPAAGAPRYVGVKFSGNFRLLYKDFNLLTPQYEEGEEIEPRYFLPIIPTVLLNGTSGIAVGFATNILNRHPIDLVNACAEVLKTGRCTTALHPWYRDFRGTVAPEGDSGRTWQFSGVYEVKNTSTVVITEIPPSYTYEKYEAVLDALVEKGTVVSYDDASSDKVSYTLKFRRKDLADLVKKKALPKLLKMHQRETENITTLDSTGNLAVFDTAQDLVEAFVRFRMGYYVKRKARMIKELTREYLILDMKARFVKAVIDGKVKVSNTPKADIVAQIKEQGIKTLNKSYDYLLTMPIYSLTKEKFVELVKKRAAKKAEKEEVEATDPKDMYSKDLATLKKQLGKEYNPPQKAARVDRPDAEEDGEYERLI
jgi:DNA topoisomerase-2